MITDGITVMVFIYAKLTQLFNADCLAFTTTTAWADIINDAGIAADRVTVNRMVDGTIADTTFLHVTDNRFKGIQILCRVTIQLYIADMTAIGQLMIWCLKLNFPERSNRIIYRYVEGIGIVIPVCYTLNGTKAFPIQTDEASGQALCRCHGSHDPCVPACVLRWSGPCSVPALIRRDGHPSVPSGILPGQ